MSTEYEVRMMVGLPRGDIAPGSLLDDLLENEELSEVEGICGRMLKPSWPFAWDQAKIDYVKKQFFDLTGQFANVYFVVWSY